MSYGTKCKRLAEHFLLEEQSVTVEREKLVKELAQRIQDVIEDFLEDLNEKEQ